ncbi:endonuclease Q family protein [Alicyclobacillus fodiniaquatilis]|jgi:uncharacterized protein (TIGR00375 family)|uniref:Endonuclease Q family protein n=1 Tax=Alicyclobacillus fodiniaquatilis TaxID=1661150 RepID=A0ABW4JHA1_9BACL
MNTYFADFHIHIGRAMGRPVKIAAGASLTLESLLFHAAFVKGLQVVTVIDAACDHVLEEIAAQMAAGTLVPHVDGGLIYCDRLLVLLGAEVEIRGPHGGAAHFGCWLPTLCAATDFNRWLRTVQKNTQLSSQLARTDATTLARQTHERQGLLIVHHAFTPFKGALGSCVDQLIELLPLADIDALELGLSSDTNMADRISELQDITYLSNSDAHGLANIAREYNEIELENLSFAEVARALHRIEGRRVQANHGLHPEHGKYYRSRCRKCDQIITSDGTGCACPTSRHQVTGVWDRLQQLADCPEPVHPAHRPPYHHQVPLAAIPGVGPAVYKRLIAAYGDELAVLTNATEGDLTDVVGAKLAQTIYQAKCGDVQWQVGGAGRYGKLVI